jgi:hypothetical protein
MIATVAKTNHVAGNTIVYLSVNRYAVSAWISSAER